MANHTLIARIDEKQSTAEEFVILSPAVGIVDRIPAEGVFINPLQTFMTLRVLGRRRAVQLPHDVQGWVTERYIDDTWAPVDYGRPLLKLSIALGPGEQRVQTGGAGAADVEAGLVPVRAPSQGVFYRRASPDSPAYVEEGSEVTTGTVLGLVEVMKCFNQIAYGGPGLPERGTVAKILVEDAAEVEHDQVMFLIRPA
jgi:biotin carboxyl carrier protein